MKTVIRNCVVLTFQELFIFLFEGKKHHLFERRPKKIISLEGECWDVIFNMPKNHCSFRGFLLPPVKVIDA